MFKLHFNNQIFQKKEDFESVDDRFPAEVKAAFSFCKAWISGEKTFIQQTSGSTGTPKKIELSRDQMLTSAQATGAFFAIHPNCRLLCCLNPDYIAGKMMLVRAMVWDCPIWLVEPEANPLLDLPEEFFPNFVAMVPLQVESCLLDVKTLGKLQKITNLIIGGAPISENLKKSLLENDIHAWQTYGMTETVSHIALAKIGTSDLSYQTLPRVEIGQDDRCALWVKSPMSGPEKIQTNDLVELTSKTSFQWLGRVDFVINSGGVKLYPELLEKKSEGCIQEVFPGSRYFFYGKKDGKLGQKLVLILESKEGTEDKARLLQEKLKSHLSKYQTPKEIYFKETFSLTPSGKIDRNLTCQTL